MKKILKKVIKNVSFHVSGNNGDSGHTGGAGEHGSIRININD